MPRADVPFASRGILLANWPLAFASFEAAREGGFDKDGSTFLLAAAVVDLVTRVAGRSEAGAFAPFGRAEAGFAFALLVDGATAREGRTSSRSSSASESSSAIDVRFAAGVLRGCPGGTISFARAAAATTCRLGVTGGTAAGGGVEGAFKGDVIVVVVVISATMSSSSSSAGGVAGVTTVWRTVTVVIVDTLVS